MVTLCLRPCILTLGGITVLIRYAEWQNVGVSLVLGEKQSQCAAFPTRLFPEHIAEHTSAPAGRRSWHGPDLEACKGILGVSEAQT